MDLFDSLDDSFEVINSVEAGEGDFSQNNQHLVQVEEQIVQIYHRLQDLYSQRFKELANLVTDPLLYIQCVGIFTNEQVVSKDMETQLKEILPSASVLVLMVSASHEFKVLPKQAYQEVSGLCVIAQELNQTYQWLKQDISSQIAQIAPNVTQIVGNQIAAQLIGAAGNIVELSRVPSCNLPALGSSKTVLHGFSSRNTSLRNGILWGSQQLDSVPQFYKNKVVKLIAGKVALAARVDAIKQHTDGSLGLKLSLEIDTKIEKMLEPLHDTKNKALPAPISEPKKKRGGKQARRKRERFAPTELQKLQNRMAFGVAEEEVLVGDEFEGLGMLSANSGVGNLRSAQIDVKRKSKFKAQNELNKRAKHDDVLGLSPSMTLEIEEGIQLPQLKISQDEVTKPESRWLSRTTGFVNIKKQV